MERELLLFILAAAGFGPAVWITALAFARLGRRRGTVASRATSAVFGPLLCGAVTAAFFVGWALQEPDPADEAVGPAFIVLAVVTAVVVLRAALRAILALVLVRAEEVTVGTIGLVRPRAVISAEFRRSAPKAVLAAALAHEAAHVRTRDPLRIWLAQIAADLQWPVPGAARRFERWLAELESRRDDEAIAQGVSPLDLAEAILTAAQFQPRCGHAPGAGIAQMAVEWRVRRLLDYSGRTASSASTARWLVVVFLFLAALLGAVALGMGDGEAFLRALPGVVTAK